RVPLTDDVLARARHSKVSMGVAARTGVGRGRKHRPCFGIVQGVVESRERARRVAERRMLGDVGYPFAVDIDLAAIAQAGEICGAGEGPRLGADCILGLHAAHGHDSSRRLGTAHLAVTQIAGWVKRWPGLRSGVAAGMPKFRLSTVILAPLPARARP